jgi:hypothetical protein
MSIEDRYAYLIGRATRGAWERLQELRDYPKLAALVNELEKVTGTLLAAHVESAYLQTLAQTARVQPPTASGCSEPAADG